MKMRNGVAVGWLAFMLVGCGQEVADGPGEYGESTGQAVLALKMKHKKKGGEATQIKFTVKKACCHHKGGGYYEGDQPKGGDCGPPGAIVKEAIVPLHDGTLPGGIEEFEKEPLDADSEHKFADQYWVLPKGCYDVYAQPLTKCGKPTCKKAWKKGVKVKDGKTTEVLLISQCKGEEVGGLDIIGVLNYPPVIRDLVFNSSKFADTCGTEKVCVTAEDPDNDPITFEWEQWSGSDVDDIVVTSTTPNPDGSVTECAEVTFTECGAFKFKVTVFDMVWDDDVMIKMEDWLQEEYGYSHVKSRDYLKFPWYVLCPCPALRIPVDESPQI